MFFSSSIKGVADVMTASTPMALTRPYTPPARAPNEHTQHDGDRRGADVHKVKPTATAGRPTHVNNTHKGAHTELTAAEHTVQATRQEQQTRISTEDNHGTKKPKKNGCGVQPCKWPTIRYWHPLPHSPHRTTTSARVSDRATASNSATDASMDAARSAQEDPRSSLSECRLEVASPVNTSSITSGCSGRGGVIESQGAQRAHGCG
jgi:hypothetical protein